MPERSAAARARSALARGALLEAYDILQQVAEHESGALDYLRVLTLARLGDTERALKLYDAYGLGARDDVDALSLQARLLKDRGFASGAGGRDATLTEACKLYARVYRRTRDTYPAVNAATLAWITGRTVLARQLARTVLANPTVQAASDYYGLATVAEARIVLGDFAGAEAALAAALAAADADAGKRSTTVLQLQRLEPTIPDRKAIAPLLAMIRPPSVASYCGHIFLEDAALEADLGKRIDAALKREDVGYAYGSLAAGSDILIAERLLARGGELHVVLPVAEEDFLAQSVIPAGGRWAERYQACRAQASSLTFSSTMSHVGGQGQFAYGAKVGMGMARLRARHLNSRAVQVAVAETAGATGTLTRSDIRAWQDTGGVSVIVEAQNIRRPVKPPGPAAVSDVGRGTHGLMFTDFPGFARLDERVLPTFQVEVMARAGVALQRNAESIRYSNTWGDALYVVFDGALQAAQTSLDLCEELTAIDTQALGVREGATMRIALHFGPTYWGEDPVTGRTNYYGSEVSRAARIEPVTPPGSVYVTEPFAAVLEMEAEHDFMCNYVGQVDLPKGYGTFPLYHLKHRG
ncbi:adenylate/guanylate cyclase domain-containing protein [Phenylobacterium sp.]|uniref:adenylate/guanylate cyclase domain-containing protein n=1 Tax=Phenylobacterium sp. TaxID=1871053 RepID=UPI0025E184D7|nr:adenylate/guanylate cyclase domain-containing protein [Phenylobacterium sp.]MBX3485828.1 adenylate/guanylate cyclase domain-containing protein [Phenylobacterium sp.]MCW5759850.1 adenylate/guanylate cyclase domain-containing protein [Phenylobacterium sp.]